MEKTIEPRRDIGIEITTDNILFFDLDGTLVDTNFANYLSYKAAIKSVIATDNDILFQPNERINRSSLKSIVPNLTKTEYEKIVHQKEKKYKDYVHQTKLIKSVVDLLVEYSKTNKTVLVTNCREERALLTLNYHRLADKFNNLFFRQISDNGKRINKFKNAITNLNIPVHMVVVFENEKEEIEDAILAGISTNNILTI